MDLVFLPTLIYSYEDVANKKVQWVLTCLIRFNTNTDCQVQNRNQSKPTSFYTWLLAPAIFSSGQVNPTHELCLYRYIKTRFSLLGLGLAAMSPSSYPFKVWTFEGFAFFYGGSCFDHLSLPKIKARVVFSIEAFCCRARAFPIEI